MRESRPWTDHTRLPARRVKPSPSSSRGPPRPAVFASCSSLHFFGFQPLVLLQNCFDGLASTLSLLAASLSPPPTIARLLSRWQLAPFILVSVFGLVQLCISFVLSFSSYFAAFSFLCPDRLTRILTIPPSANEKSRRGNNKPLTRPPANQRTSPGTPCNTLSVPLLFCLLPIFFYFAPLRSFNFSTFSTSVPHSGHIFFFRARLPAAIVCLCCSLRTASPRSPIARRGLAFRSSFAQRRCPTRLHDLAAAQLVRHETAPCLPITSAVALSSWLAPFFPSLSPIVAKPFSRPRLSVAELLHVSFRSRQ